LPTTADIRLCYSGVWLLISTLIWQHVTYIHFALAHVITDLHSAVAACDYLYPLAMCDYLYPLCCSSMWLLISTLQSRRVFTYVHFASGVWYITNIHSAVVVFVYWCTRTLCSSGVWYITNIHSVLTAWHYVFIHSALTACKILTSPLYYSGVWLFISTALAACDYWRWGSGGQQESINAICILALNIINDKVGRSFSLHISTGTGTFQSQQ
jgi:hypothetical protein